MVLYSFCWSFIKIPTVIRNYVDRRYHIMALASVRSIVIAIMLVSVLVMLLVNRFSQSLTEQYFSSGTTAAVQVATTSPPRNSRVHRILCYGDSLTAGTSPPGAEYYPYAPHLEQALKDRGLENVLVRHRGLPGWTTQQMLNDLDGERTGLRSAIKGAIEQDPVAGVSLVILLAGTNDMAYHATADQIATNVRALHQVSYENGVARTLAIGIPPSGYQSNVNSAAALAAEINGKLEQWVSHEDKASYIASPFPFERGGENWARDTLHFSPRGYQVFGESLAPIVEQILDSLN
jgi:lysophospholipase L1-like esterase